MWKRMLDKLDERKQLLLSAGAVGLCLVLAAVFPLLFRTQPQPRAETPSEYGSVLEHKIALFQDFWANGGAAAAETQSIIPDREMETFCEERMRAIVARGVDDRELSYTMPTGREYTLVSDDTGAVRLCRMWLQARGDWQNWVDACFDAETGRIYYLYISRECLTNRGLYAGTERGTAESVANALAEAGGGTLRHFNGDNRDGTALVESESGLICYEIKCNWYDALIDVRIICV